MKFFNTFDTTRYKEKLKLALTEMGEGNLIMFKKHITYLSRTILTYFVSLFGFIGLIISLHTQLYNQEILYTIFLGISIILFSVWSIYFFIGCLRSLLGTSPISDSFDTISCLKNRFHFFIRFTLVLFFLHAGVLISSIILELYLPNTEDIMRSASIYLNIFSSIIYMFGVYYTLKVVIRYEMDHYMITPTYVDITEQHGLFEKINTSLPLARLTMVSVISSGFLQSIFRYGTLSFLSDDIIHATDGISIDHVPKPMLIKNKFNTIIKKYSTPLVTPRATGISEKISKII